MATALASVFVEARLDTSKFGSDVKTGMSSSSVSSATATAGTEAGKSFSAKFSSALKSVVSKVPVPELPKLPTLAAPEIDTPEIPVPDLPTLPTLAAPKVDLPEIPFPDLPTLPTLDAPEVGMPIVPELTLPKIPTLDAPEVGQPTIPELTLPKIPTLDAPKVGTPEIPALELPKIPTLDAPKVGMPEIPDPDLPQIPALDAPEMPAPDLSQFKAGLAKMGPLIAAAGVTAAAGGGLLGAINVDAGKDKLAAQLGSTAKESERQGRIAGSLYSGAYGDSMETVDVALRGVTQNIGGIAAKGQLEDVTAKVLDIAAAFDQDSDSITRAAGQLVKTGMAKNAREALDIITTGFQNGANKSDDLLDTFNEYGTQFRKLGIDGKTALGIISQGIQGGARDADIVADSFKEFSLRTQGALTTSKNVGGKTVLALTPLGNAFKSAGIDALDAGGKGKILADTLQKDIAGGGKKAKEGLDFLLDGLRNTKDPLAQGVNGVALFGTQYEDMGAALTNIDLSKASKQVGDIGGAATKMGNTLNDNASVNIESFRRTLTTAFVNFIGAKVVPALNTFAKLAIGFFTKLRDEGSDTGTQLGKFVSAVRTGFGTLVEFVQTNLPKIRATVSAVFNGIADTAVPVLKEFGRLVKTVFEGALTTVQENWTTIKSVVTTAISAAAIALKGFAATLRTVFGSMADHTTTLKVVAAVITAVFIPAMVKAGVQAVIAKVRLVGAWVATQYAAVKSAAMVGVSFAVMAAGWVRSAAVAMKSALRIAAAWLISMGPIALVVVAVVGLGVVIYKNFDRIKGWIGGAWDWVKDKTAAAWNAIKSALSNTWDAIRSGISTAVGKVKSTLSNAWGAIKTGVGTAWNGFKTVISTVWDAIKTVVGKALTVIKTVLSAAWAVIKTGALKWWNGFKTVIFNVFDAITTAIGKALGGWKTLLGKAWTAIKTVASTAWGNIKTNILNVFTGIRTGIGTGIDKLKTLLGNAWDTIKTGAGKAWGGIVGAIKTAFGKVVDVVKSPINKVIGIINKYLIGGFNDLADKVGLSIEIGDIKTFAKGGIYPGYTPGRDIGLAAVSGGEAIMRPEWTRAIGPDRVDAMNAAARIGGVEGARKYMGSFASGGRVSMDGEPLDTTTARQIRLAEGLARQNIYVIQGSFQPHTSYSGSTHTGAGAADVSPVTDSIVRAMQASGFAAWDRTGKGDWGPHIHAISRYANGVDSAARGQVSSYVSGSGDGLGGSAYGPRTPLVSGLAKLLGQSVSAAELNALPSSGFVADPGIMDAISNPIEFLKDKIAGPLAALGDNPMVDIIKGVPMRAVSMVGDYIKDKLGGFLSRTFVTGGGGDVYDTYRKIAGGNLGNVGDFANTTSTTGIRAMVAKMAAGRGWGDASNLGSLNALISQESSWNPRAQNPTSSAYGLFQFLDSTWPAGAKTSDPALQTKYGLNYISSRYGNPVKAWDFHTAHNWYDAGGVATGRGYLPKVTPAPERVLSPRQTTAFENMMNRGGLSGSGRQAITITNWREGTGWIEQIADGSISADRDYSRTLGRQGVR